MISQSQLESWLCKNAKCIFSKIGSLLKSHNSWFWIIFYYLLLSTNKIASFRHTCTNKYFWLIIFVFSYKIHVLGCGCCVNYVTAKQVFLLCNQRNIFSLGYTHDYTCTCTLPYSLLSLLKTQLQYTSLRFVQCVKSYGNISLKKMEWVHNFF